MEQLQALHLAQEAYLLLGGGVGGELVRPAVEEDGAGDVGVPLVDFGKFQHELRVFPQKQHLVVGLDCLAVPFFTTQIASQRQLVGQTLVNDLVLRSLLHLQRKQRKQTITASTEPPLLLLLLPFSFPLFLTTLPSLLLRLDELDACGRVRTEFGHGALVQNRQIEFSFIDVAHLLQFRRSFLFTQFHDGIEGLFWEAFGGDEDCRGEPWMVVEFLHGDAGLGVDVEAALEDGDAVGGEVAGDGRWESVLARLDAFYGVGRGGPPEGQFADQHAVEDDSGRPYVQPPVEFLVLGVDEALGRHVGETAGVEVLPLEGADGPGDAEVDDLDPAVLRVDQKKILKLEVAVGQVALMAVEHALDDLPQKTPGRPLTQPSCCLYVLQEFPALQVLHDDHHFHVAQREAFMNPHDVGVVERPEDFCLYEDGVDVCGRPDVFGLDDLDGKLLTALLVARQEDLPKPAFAQHPCHLVLGETASRVEFLPPRCVED